MGAAPSGTREALLARIAEEVRDARILAAVRALPREAFVPPELAGRAWQDAPLPIGDGQTISQPSLVARMCDLLALRGDERVLDVGTGSGYAAALLGRLAAHVTSVERHPALAERARAALAACGIANVEVVVGDATGGLPGTAPFDAIHVAATADGGLPPALLAALAPGGRCIAPVRRGRDERLELVRRGADGTLSTEALERVRFVPLVVGGDGGGGRC